MTPLLLRWLKFNAVGTLGVGVQLATLAVLVSGLRMDYLLSTALAVESAVLHNFLWHEYFTWRDRTRAARTGSLRRLLSFHASNGLVSLLGSLFAMRLLVGVMRIPYILANVIAIAGCGVVNFLLAEMVVFIAMPKRPSGA